MEQIMEQYGGALFELLIGGAFVGVVVGVLSLVCCGF